jgi:hypothetical protein
MLQFLSNIVRNIAIEFWTQNSKDPKLVECTLFTFPNGRLELFTIWSIGIEGGHVINTLRDTYYQVALKE